MFEKLLYPYHRARMSELGKELAEAMVHDAWDLTEHRLTHRTSGASLWISNGYNHFRLHDVTGLRISESQLQQTLNSHDRYVLWYLFQERLRRVPSKNAETILNLLRLKRQHTTEKET